MWTDALGEYMVSLGITALPIAAGGIADNHVWKFRATQLTYNSNSGDWASKDMAVLESLFKRLVCFAQNKAKALHMKGVSATLEESLVTGEHAHAHFFFHMEREFRGKGPGALDRFAFEGIHPHIVTNKANGGAWHGAVNHGHFYVVVDKKGTLFNWFVRTYSLYIFCSRNTFPRQPRPRKTSAFTSLPVHAQQINSRCSVPEHIFKTCFCRLVRLRAVCQLQGGSLVDGQFVESREGHARGVFELLCSHRCRFQAALGGCPRRSAV